MRHFSTKRETFLLSPKDWVERDENQPNPCDIKINHRGLTPDRFAVPTSDYMSDVRFDFVPRRSRTNSARAFPSREAPSANERFSSFALYR